MKFGERKSIENPISPEKEKGLLKETTVYINAGGRGTRLESILEHDPETGIAKALIEIKGVPIIKLLSDNLVHQGFGSVLIGAGDHKKIADLYKNKEDEEKESSKANVDVVNFNDELGTGGDLLRTIRRENNNIKENILVQNVDTAVVFNAEKLLEQHKKTGASATIVLTRRQGVPNKDAFLIGHDNKILFSKETKDPKYIIKEPDQEMIKYKASSTGVIIFDKKALLDFDWSETDGPISIYNQILGKLIKDGKIYAYDNGENFFMDIGTPENYMKAVQKHPILFGYMYGSDLSKK
ncbi:MAG: NTP transferase domain-containing protein [Patescibacteria group bacterium]|nr:NTP transferase domain-containing protein [Patescibacteria group bacterium]